MQGDISAVKRMLQDHLQEGLLLVVGSGLSIAEGIPGMSGLAEHLKANMGNHLDKSPDLEWEKVVAALDSGNNLEDAISQTQLSNNTINSIIEETTKLISKAERKVFADVISGIRSLSFTYFAKHLLKAANSKKDKAFHLITTNYDRLIEFAVEMVGIGVDTGFTGMLWGTYDLHRSSDAHRETYFEGRNAKFRFKPHLRVYKPHGSLDWFEHNNNVVRIPVVDTAYGRPLIITPGSGKYRKSFQTAFDNQRNDGNAAADRSSSFMFIGYGFNDDHLEQHLCRDRTLEKPTVILARTLSSNAINVIENSTRTEVIALSAVPENTSQTKVTFSDPARNSLIINEELWHLDGFNKGVLK
jgi:hypothetical protein